MVYTAYWVPQEVCYRVEHYTLENGSYQLRATSYHTGRTGDKVSVKDIQGRFDGYALRDATCGYEHTFTPTLSGDGSTVIKLFYTSTTHTFRWMYNANNEIGHASVAAGSRLSGIYPETASRENYIFTGWYTDTACTQPFTATVMPDEDLTIYAGWEELTYTVTFDTGDADTTFTQIVHPKSYPYVHTPDDPVKTGHDFGGWFRDQKYTQRMDFTWQDKLTGDLTLYAKWTPSTYTITYDLDGGTIPANATAPTNYTYGQGFFLPTPTKKGYLFRGWQGADGQMYDGPVNKDVHGNLQLTATWELNPGIQYVAKHYWQNLDDDGYTLHETDDDHFGTMGTLTDVKANNYSGFIAKSITQQTIDADGTTVVEVYYDRQLCTIKWVDGNGKTIQTDTGVRYGAPISYKDSDTPTKTSTAQYDYIFNNKWYNGTQLLGENPTATGDMTCTAGFNEDLRSYTVTWIVEGTKYTSEAYYGRTPSYPRSTPTKPSDGDGYVYAFTGWTPALTEVTGEATYTAQFEKQQAWTVTFDPNGGKLSGARVYYVKDGEKFSEPPKPTRPGYTFNYWTDERGVKYTFTSPVTGNLTLTAQWYAQSYTITYVDGSSETTATYYPAYLTLPKTPTKSGYTFLGWYNTSYYDADSRVTALPYNNNYGDITLYAKWKAKASETYDLKLNGVPIDSDTKVKDGTKDITGLGITYNSDTHTLTLNGANIESAMYSYSSNPAAVLYADMEDLTIELVGTNSITNTADLSFGSRTDGAIYGIYSTGSIHFTGSGTLTVTTQDVPTAQTNTAIDTYNSVTVSCAELTAKAGQAQESYGINSFNTSSGLQPLYLTGYNTGYQNGYSYLTARGYSAAINTPGVYSALGSTTLCQIESANEDASGSLKTLSDKPEATLENLAKYKHIELVSNSNGT